MICPSRRRRSRGDRGAVLTEYAVVLGLVLVVSLGVIEVLQDRSQAEVDHQANCVSTRPPPPSCQPRTVTTLPPSSIPPTSASTTAPPAAVSGTATVANARIEDQTGGIWDAVADVTFHTDGDPSVPYEGATVRVRVTITAPANPTPFFVDCVTAADGMCELRFTTPAPGITGMTFDFETVEGFSGTVSSSGFPIVYTHP